jgi:hypothetical protein
MTFTATSRYRRNESMSSRLPNLGWITTKRLLATTILLAAKLLAYSAGVAPSVEGQSLPLVTLNPPTAAQLSCPAKHTMSTQVR